MKTAMQMSKPLLIKNSIVISVPATKVWEVLVNPLFLKQWHNLPDNFSDEPLSIGREIILKNEGGKTTMLTVSAFHPPYLLRLSLHVSGWKTTFAPEQIAYTYTLAEKRGNTLLTCIVGNFGLLPDGENYYQDLLMFGSEALQKIKQLVERSISDE